MAEIAHWRWMARGKFNLSPLWGGTSSARRDWTGMGGTGSKEITPEMLPLQTLPAASWCRRLKKCKKRNKTGKSTTNELLMRLSLCIQHSTKGRVLWSWKLFSKSKGMCCPAGKEGKIKTLITVHPLSPHPLLFLHPSTNFLVHPAHPLQCPTQFPAPASNGHQFW